MIAIQAIKGKTKPPSQICNFLEDITAFVKVIENIKFLYYIESANALANRILKRVHSIVLTVIYNN